MILFKAYPTLLFVDILLSLMCLPIVSCIKLFGLVIGTAVKLLRMISPIGVVICSVLVTVIITPSVGFVLFGPRRIAFGMMIMIMPTMVVMMI